VILTDRRPMRAPRSLPFVVMGWRPGDVLVRREVLGLWPVPTPDEPAAWWGEPWMAMPVRVIEDSAERLVTYVAPGAPFGFRDGAWPTPDGRHPWHERPAWGGHECLMVQRPGDDHAVWHFWTGADRAFRCWYINLQTAFVPTPIGFDTMDLELDLVVFPTGDYVVKDLDVLPERVAEGRLTQAVVDHVIALGERLTAELDAGRWWWDTAWAGWTPDPGDRVPELRSDWSSPAPMRRRP
jgi:hypothetical protein